MFNLAFIYWFSSFPTSGLILDPETHCENLVMISYLLLQCVQYYVAFEPNEYIYGQGNRMSGRGPRCCCNLPIAASFMAGTHMLTISWNALNILQGYQHLIFFWILHWPPGLFDSPQPLSSCILFSDPLDNSPLTLQTTLKGRPLTVCFVCAYSLWCPIYQRKHRSLNLHKLKCIITVVVSSFPCQDGLLHSPSLRLAFPTWET